MGYWCINYDELDTDTIVTTHSCMKMQEAFCAESNTKNHYMHQMKKEYIRKSASTKRSWTSSSTMWLKLVKWCGLWTKASSKCPAVTYTMDAPRSSWQGFGLCPEIGRGIAEATIIASLPTTNEITYKPSPSSAKGITSLGHANISLEHTPSEEL